jgi:hypothetical protein
MNKVIDPQEFESELKCFTGSEDYYRDMMGVFHTDGVQYLAEHAGAFWLIDAIVSHQSNPKVRREEFQVWRLIKTPNRIDIAAVLICTDGGKDELPGEGVIARQEIPYTDFPLSEIRLYLENGSLDGKNVHKILMLPSER